MGRSSPAAPGGGGGGDAGGRGPSDPEDDPASTSFALGGGWLGAGAVRFAAKAENAASGNSAAPASPSSAPSSTRPRRRGHHLSDADLDEPVPRELTDLAAPHVESFDAFLERGLDLVVKRLPAVEVS